MKSIRKMFSFLVAVLLMAACVACSDDVVNTGGGSGSFYIDEEIYNKLPAEYQFDVDALKENKSKYSGTLYMARAYADELSGWEYVYDAYEKMYPNVTIVNSEYSSGQSMKSALTVQMSSSSTEVGLMQGNYVNDLLKQYGYNFQGGFVDTVNPYASPAGEGNEVLVGDLLDDYTYENLAATRITFQKTSTCFFVNTTALAEVGLTAEDIQTWDDIIDACALLQAKGYTAPFGIGGANDSVTSKDFKWMYRIYLDQYYRDLIDDIQVQPEDYNYNKNKAEAFEFSFEKNDYETDPNYAVNSMRGYNLLLNTEADNPYYVGAASDKFKCFLSNLFRIGPYVSKGFATNNITEIQQSFLRGGKDDAVFMVNYVGYGIALENYKNRGEIDFDWACFDYVPMVCHCDVACNNADGNHTCSHVDNAETEDQCTLHCRTTSTRDEGGVGGFIGFYTEGKTSEEIDLYLDFIRFFLSPYGQSLFYKGLEENAGWPKALSVIDGAVFPESWDNFNTYSAGIEFNGLCANWFTDFLTGCANATGSEYSICKTALQNNIPGGAANVNTVSGVFDAQIRIYTAEEKLAQYVNECYKNYTQKPASK